MIKQHIKRLFGVSAMGLVLTGAFLLVGAPIASAAQAPPVATPAGKCCSDGKPASKSAQREACKKTSGATYTQCVKLAQLPDWWWPGDDGVNYHRPNGVNIIKAIRGEEPYQYWLADFTRNIKLYNDNHAHANG